MSRSQAPLLEPLVKFTRRRDFIRTTTQGSTSTKKLLRHLLVKVTRNIGIQSSGTARSEGFGIRELDRKGSRRALRYFGGCQKKPCPLARLVLIIAEIQISL